LTENSILVEVEKTRPLDFPFGLWIDYKNNPSGMSFDIQIKEERHLQNHITMILILDITDIPRAVFNGTELLEGERGFFLLPTLFSNEEAILTISLPRAHLEADIFIGEDRIDVLEQRFRAHAGWR